MKNFEKCTVAMLGGSCLQHVTGNTSRENQPQSAIMQPRPYILWFMVRPAWPVHFCHHDEIQPVQ